MLFMIKFLKWVFVWKMAISIYMMSIVCISLFTWANLRFVTVGSILGVLNLILAFILKLF